MNTIKRYLSDCVNCHHKFYWFEDNPKPCPKCGCKTVKSVSPPDIPGLEKALELKGQDRLLATRVRYNRDDNRIIIGIWLYPAANELAMKNYCQIAKEFAQKYAPEQEFSALVFKGKEIVYSSHRAGIK